MISEYTLMVESGLSAMVSPWEFSSPAKYLMRVHLVCSTYEKSNVAVPRRLISEEKPGGADDFVRVGN